MSGLAASLIQDGFLPHTCFHARLATCTVVMYMTLCCHHRCSHTAGNQPVPCPACSQASRQLSLTQMCVKAQLHLLRKCGPRHCLSGIRLTPVMLCRRCSCNWSSCCCSSAPPRGSRRPLRCARTGWSSLNKSRLQNMPGKPAAESKPTTLHCTLSSLASHLIALQPDDAVLTPACCAAFVLADLPADGGSLKPHMRTAAAGAGHLDGQRRVDRAGCPTLLFPYNMCIFHGKAFLCCCG